MKMLLTAVGAVAVFFTLSCNGTKKTTSTENIPNSDWVEEFAKNKFEDEYVTDYNSTSEFVVVSKAYKIKPSDPLPTIRFHILENGTKEELFMDAVPGGEVKWIEEFVVEVISKRVIPNPEESSGPKTYKYHVKNRKRFTDGFPGKNN